MGFFLLFQLLNSICSESCFPFVQYTHFSTLCSSFIIFHAHTSISIAISFPLSRPLILSYSFSISLSPLLRFFALNPFHTFSCLLLLLSFSIGLELFYSSPLSPSPSLSLRFYSSTRFFVSSPRIRGSFISIERKLAFSINVN